MVNMDRVFEHFKQITSKTMVIALQDAAVAAGGDQLNFNKEDIGYTLSAQEKQYPCTWADALSASL